MTFTHHYDDSSAWLEVPMETVQELGVESKITHNSRVDGTTVYLNFDIEALEFIWAYEKKHDQPLKRKLKYTPVSFINYLERFKHAV
tara:strand:+ start:137 stop:397 length:261 start_codon:yes stop_codon:yes gene_type:complete